MTAQVTYLQTSSSEQIQKFQHAVSEKSKKILIIICAYNEGNNLPNLLKSLTKKDVLVVDDGSQDKTGKIATAFGASVLSHEKRVGKASSLADGISYALQNSYDTVVEIDADAITDDESIRALADAIEVPGVGGASCKQYPIGPKNLAYYIDELIWAMLIEGKRLQMSRFGSSHLGSVMVAFKPELVDLVEGCVNDDEEINISIKMKGQKTVFVENSMAYFDASSCIGHILQRRIRMYVGHMKYKESMAPSMQFLTSAIALVKAVDKRPTRSVWTAPALLLDLYARLIAWADSRRPNKSGKYTRWVTTYSKNKTMIIRNIPVR